MDIGTRKYLSYLKNLRGALRDTIDINWEKGSDIESIINNAEALSQVGFLNEAYEESTDERLFLNNNKFLRQEIYKTQQEKMRDLGYSEDEIKEYENSLENSIHNELIGIDLTSTDAFSFLDKSMCELDIDADLASLQSVYGAVDGYEEDESSDESSWEDADEIAGDEVEDSVVTPVVESKGGTVMDGMSDTLKSLIQDREKFAVENGLGDNLSNDDYEDDENNAELYGLLFGNNGEDVNEDIANEDAKAFDDDEDLEDDNDNGDSDDNGDFNGIDWDDEETVDDNGGNSLSDELESLLGIGKYEDEGIDDDIFDDEDDVDNDKNSEIECILGTGEYEDDNDGMLVENIFDDDDEEEEEDSVIESLLGLHSYEEDNLVEENIFDDDEEEGINDEEAEEGYYEDDMVDDGSFSDYDDYEDDMVDDGSFADYDDYEDDMIDDGSFADDDEEYEDNDEYEDIDVYGDDEDIDVYGDDEEEEDNEGGNEVDEISLINSDIYDEEQSDNDYDPFDDDEDEAEVDYESEEQGGTYDIYGDNDEQDGFSWDDDGTDNINYDDFRVDNRNNYNKKPNSEQFGGINQDGILYNNVKGVNNIDMGGNVNNTANIDENRTLQSDYADLIVKASDKIVGLFKRKPKNVNPDDEVDLW